MAQGKILLSKPAPGLQPIRERHSISPHHPSVPFTATTTSTTKLNTTPIHQQIAKSIKYSSESINLVSKTTSSQSEIISLALQQWRTSLITLGLRRSGKLTITTRTTTLPPLTVANQHFLALLIGDNDSKEEVHDEIVVRTD